MVVATKVCSKCGWEFPVTSKGRNCRFCKTPFLEGFCASCGTYGKFATGTPHCKKCHSKKTNDPKYNYRKYQKPLEEAEDRFDEWLHVISKVPLPARTLTQDEWLEACAYFGKCAVCSSEEIAARSFFVTFKFGGRYANWNIIPVCEKCATSLVHQQNPFIHYHTWLNFNIKKRGVTSDTIKNITAYLRPRLEAASNGKTS